MMRAEASNAGVSQETRSPTTPLLYAAMVLSGLGTTLVGPILPLLIVHWGLRDSQAGLLLTAQFLGLSVGSVAIAHRLERSFVLGIFASLAGLGGLAGSVVLPNSPGGLGAMPHLAAGVFSLWVAGFGLGQLITCINLIGGARYSSRRGSALSLLNFFWSVGAVLSPLLAAWLTPRFSLPEMLGGFACGFLLLGAEAGRQRILASLTGSPTPGNTLRDAHAATTISDGMTGVPGRTLLLFAALFFLYGGVESSLNGWLTTYTLRYGGHGLATSEFSTLLFWTSLTAGRAMSALLLQKTTETALRAGSLIAAVLVTGGLIYAQTLTAISMCAVLLGLSLAPCFPTTLALLLDQRPRPRQAAVALAVTGLGGAALAWLMGKASTHAGSLQAAVWVPLMGVVALLVLSLVAQPITLFRGKANR